MDPVASGSRGRRICAILITILFIALVDRGVLTILTVNAGVDVLFLNLAFLYLAPLPLHVSVLHANWPLPFIRCEILRLVGFVKAVDEGQEVAGNVAPLMARVVDQVQCLIIHSHLDIFIPAVGVRAGLALHLQLAW